MLNIETSKSYATEDNLLKALKRLGLDDKARPLVVCNRKGRFTAVFSASHLQVVNFGVIAAAQHGFMTI